jgi:hypothetical protein
MKGMGETSSLPLMLLALFLRTSYPDSHGQIIMPELLTTVLQPKRLKPTSLGVRDARKILGVQIDEQTHVFEQQVQDEIHFSSFAMSDAIVIIPQPQPQPQGEAVKVREDVGIPSQQSHHQTPAQN